MRHAGCARSAGPHAAAAAAGRAAVGRERGRRPATCPTTRSRTGAGPYSHGREVRPSRCPSADYRSVGPGFFETARHRARERPRASRDADGPKTAARGASCDELLASRGRGRARRRLASGCAWDPYSNGETRHLGRPWSASARHVRGTAACVEPPQRAGLLPAQPRRSAIRWRTSCEPAAEPSELAPAVRAADSRRRPDGCRSTRSQPLAREPGARARGAALHDDARRRSSRRSALLLAVDRRLRRDRLRRRRSAGASSG